MADVKWIKIVTDIFDDEKVLLIESLPSADSLIVIWFKLLCLAGKNNNNGVFMLNDRIAYTDEMLATIFRRDINTVRLALNTFEDFGMIEKVDGIITIPNWGKHQTMDKLEAKKEYMREYMQGYREKQKALIECKTNGKTNCKTNSKSNGKTNSKTNGSTNRKANVSSLDIERDKKELDKKELDKKERERKKANAFTPPTLEEVKSYCTEHGFIVNPEVFISYYSAKGWYMGKTKMFDWTQCLTLWENREQERLRQQQSGGARNFANIPVSPSYEDMSELERQLLDN